MDIQTAIAQIEKESEFLGLGFLETLQDIQKYGATLYCEQTMIAFRVFMTEGQKMFAPA